MVRQLGKLGNAGDIESGEIRYLLRVVSRFESLSELESASSLPMADGGALRAAGRGGGGVLAGSALSSESRAISVHYRVLARAL